MAISWVADEKATTSANSAIWVRFCVGSVADMPRIPRPMPIMAKSIQLRRLPMARVKNGSGRRSTTGAQKNLIE